MASLTDTMSFHGTTINLDIMVIEVFDLISIELQPRTHVIRNILLIESPSFHITQNLVGAVISRHDNISVIIAHIEHIIIRIFRRRGILARRFKG